MYKLFTINNDDRTFFTFFANFVDNVFLKIVIYDIQPYYPLELIHF